MATLRPWIYIAPAIAIVLSIDKVVVGETKIIATSLINPVPEGAILSVLCQVWNLEDGQMIVITRQTSTHSEMLAWNKVILAINEERIFLAERQKEDGSMIHFMTLMDVQKADKGKYSCKVMKLVSERPKIVAWSSVHISVQYFPSKTYPICFPEEPLVLHAGCNLTFNCSSEMTSPVVAISWTKSGATLSDNVDLLERDSLIYSVLNVTITELDDGSVFVCRISSSAFYNRIQTCSIGPISVISSNLSLGKANTPEQGTQPVDFDRNLLLSSSGNANQTLSYQNCHELCPKHSTPFLYFIIVTVIAVILGVIFFVLAVLFLTKYCRMKTPPKPENVPLNRHTDEIYADIDGIRAANRVYMTLETPQSRGGHYEGQYKIRYAGIYKPHYV